MSAEGRTVEGGSASRERSWTARTWARVRRPDGLVEQTRRLFALSAVLALAATLPKPLITMDPGDRVLAVAASAGLAGVWLGRYLARRDPLLLDLLELAALVALVVAFPVPGAVFVFIVSAVWLRALYGTGPRAALFCALLSGGVLAAVPVWARVHGGDAGDQALSMVVPIPALWLTMLVARSLARSLFAREQSQQRDAALLELGRRLIGLTDADVIHREARRFVRSICAATPGLRTLLLRGEPDGLRVCAPVGRFSQVPALLPRTLLPAGTAPGEAHRCPPGPELDALAGPDVRWVLVPLPEQPEGWMALGAPGGIPAEAVVAVRSVANQVALALRTSAAHRDLTAQALVDPLTGLANRSAFTAALERERRAPARGCALLFLDLDDFKRVNDELGHAAGDEVLRHIAARLGRALRPHDLCARLGGDEFAVLLPDSGDTAHAVARRLVRLVAAPVSVGGRLVGVGASIGLAFAAPDVSPDELLRHADAAMYAAKAGGKNRVQVFDLSLLGDTGPAEFEGELAAAAAAGQLEVHYQPIVSVADGSPVAVEALVRWRHPTRGLLGPGEFVPAAERTGAILDIGAHVLGRACADAAAWVGPAGPLALHVNVSAAQLTEPRFLAAVGERIAEHGFAAGRLVLEVTESAVLDSPVIEHALDRLIELGAAIAVDDFGTGYSALSTLRTLPLEVVKIDRSFLAGCPGRAADGAVVEAIVEVAGRLGLRIVAEGVERPDQREFLRRVGADASQGYLHLPPVPAAELERWLAEQLVDVGAVAVDPLAGVRQRSVERTGRAAWGAVAAPPRRTG